MVDQFNFPDGLKGTLYRDQAVAPTVKGMIQRLGARLNFFDGTVAQQVAWTSDPTVTIAVVTAFTVSGTFTKNANTLFARVICIGGGAGGGGGSASAANATSGGGGGAYSEDWVSSATLGASQVVTIGPGGAGGTTPNGTGGTGGDSSVGTLVVAKGGSGGGGVDSAGANGGVGGLASGGTGAIKISGAFGDMGITDQVNFRSGGGGGHSGGGYGAGGLGRPTAGVGVAGLAFGGGGGGANGNNAGGAGGIGAVIVVEFRSA